MKYTYPVIFEYDDDKIGVKVPDISGCFTFGETITEAIEMAADAMAMMLAHYEDHRQAIPKPSDISIAHMSIFFSCGFFLSVL